MAIDTTALDGTVGTDDVVAALDQEMIENFKGDLTRLTDVLGIFSPEVVAAGTTMFTYTVSGALDSSDVAEGAEVPLSEYKVEKNPVDTIEVKPYRKLTTAQAILKSGFTNAILKTDAKMIAHVRDGILTDFFEFLATGTGSASGTGLQGALAQADAKLQSELETNGDAADRVIHFVNPFDIADYLANAQVTLQTVFGMQYLQSFLGVGDVFVTNRVEQGTVYVTPVDNIHLYGIDFGSLGEAGLQYTSQDGSLIGVHHEANYTRTSAETYVLTGALMIAEVLNYIVAAEIESGE